jgi:hypothetical protein
MIENSTVDPAAIFCCAVSLRDSAIPLSDVAHYTLSDAYSGWNTFLQEVMRVATLFETWATAHVAFDHLGEVWPYLMEERFGDACVHVADIWALTSFHEMDCLHIAQYLRLPLYYDDELGIPLDIRAGNTVAGSAYAEFGIQSVRWHRAEAIVIPFIRGDDPWDEEYEFPRLALCGITVEGQMERIAEFTSYRDAVSLVTKLAPGIDFPGKPVVIG